MAFLQTASQRTVFRQTQFPEFLGISQ